jgi:hypothetical protein
MTDLGTSVLWRLFKDVLSGRATLESATALCFIITVIIIISDPEYQTAPMFVLLAMLLITYVTVSKAKGPDKMVISNLKDQFVEMVSTISLLDSRDKKYAQAVKDLGRLTVRFGDEMRVLKTILNGKPSNVEASKKEQPEPVDPTTQTLFNPSERFGRGDKI